MCGSRLCNSCSGADCSDNVRCVECQLALSRQQEDQDEWDWQPVHLDSIAALSPKHGQAAPIPMVGNEAVAALSPKSGQAAPTPMVGNDAGDKDFSEPDFGGSISSEDPDTVPAESDGEPGALHRGASCQSSTATRTCQVMSQETQTSR